MKASETSREWIKKVILYQFIGLLIALVFHIYGENTRPFLDNLWGSLVFTNCISFLIEFIYVLIPGLRHQPGCPITFGDFIRHVFVVAFGMTAGSELAMVILKYFGIVYFPFASMTHLVFQLMNIAISVVIVGIMASFYRLKTRLEIKNREYRDLENLQVKTRLAVLQARINPHFLFNTLNTILDLIYKSPQKAETVVLNLSDIYRDVLSQSGYETVPLEKELDLVRKYLEIEKIRMDERLNYRIECAEGLRAFEIPPLLLEPIVENAVIHGIAPRKEGGSILIRVEEKEGKCSICIEDTGQGIQSDDISGGFGIFSVRERLKLLYEEKASFSVEPGPKGGTRVKLEVPIEHRYGNR